MFWKIYFWIVTTLLIVSNIGTRGWTTVDYIGDAALVVGLIAMFGYAHNKKILSTDTWKIVAPAVTAIWYVYQLYLDRLYGGNPPVTNQDLLLEVSLSLPIFIAALLYAYKPKNKVL